ncbi:MAG: glycosyltransferase family 39 protein, partial [Anaerolineales bacterium]
MSASRANVRRLVGGLLVFIWAALVLGAYYAVHKPLPPAQLPGVVVTLHGLAAAAATLVVSYAVGRGAVARWFGREPAGLRLALSIGLGSGGLAIGFVLAGALALYHPVTALTAVAAALVYVLRRRADFRALRLPRVRGALAWFVVGVSGVAFLQAATPPTAWDALVYHLTGPELYVQAGRLVHPIDLHYLGFPQWGEALFTFGMLLGSDRAPALLHWTFAILTLVVVYETVRRILPTRGILAVALLAATPSAMLLAGIPYVDWFAMFAVALAFYALLRWGEAGERRWLALAGAGAGLAFAAKYSSAGAILGLAAGAAHLQAATRNRSFGQLARNVAAFVVPAVLVALPWLFKNLALTGNPLYPFFFDGLYWDELRRWWY